VDWRVVAWYSVSDAPAAALGAATLLVLPPRLVEAVLGLFFMVMIPLRRWMTRQHWSLRLPHMTAVGAVVGFVTGIVVSSGPINVPFFLAYGLVKGAFLSTEAMASLLVYAAKTLVFGSLGALPLASVGKGLVVGCRTGRCPPSRAGRSRR
jgi:uncharacterized protein